MCARLFLEPERHQNRQLSLIGYERAPVDNAQQVASRYAAYPLSDRRKTEMCRNPRLGECSLLAESGRSDATPGRKNSKTTKPADAKRHSSETSPICVG